MKSGKKKIQLFKIRNRRGFAAVCLGCLTEGNTKGQVVERMVKALRRVTRRK